MIMSYVQLVEKLNTLTERLENCFIIVTLFVFVAWMVSLWFLSSQTAVPLVMIFFVCFNLFATIGRETREFREKYFNLRSPSFFL